MSDAPRWRVPLARPDLDDDDRAAVASVLGGTTLSLGPELQGFEEDLSARLSDRPVVAVSSGTAGLYLALRALGVDGGEVITPAYGFVGTAHAIRLAGAEPRFVDVSPETLCVTPETVERGLTERTRAVIPVDLFGTPAPTREIVDWAHEKGLVVVEDACEALGAVRGGERVGAIGDCGVFAFYPNKQITTGEGGAIVAQDPEIARKLISFRNQGRGQGEFEFVGEGFNFRLTEMQAALGRSQLRRLEPLLARRAALAKAYERRLREIPGLATLPPTEEGSTRSWFVFPVFLEERSWRDPVRAALAARGVQTSPYFPPVHEFEPFRDSPRDPAGLAIAESAGARGFAIPFFTALSADDLDEIVDLLAEALAPLASGSGQVSLQTLLTADA